MKKQTVLLLAAVAMLLLFAGGAWWYQNWQAEKASALARENSPTLVPDHAITLGPASARVTIVEFFDPACETCAVFHKHVHDLIAADPQRIRLVLRYAPFHQGSRAVVKILEAARRQDKYWETLELLFASQNHWASHHKAKAELVWPLLSQVGVDVERLRADTNDPALSALVRQDLLDAAKLGIRKTPGFLVNGKPLTSFGLPQLQQLVQSEIDARY